MPFGTRPEFHHDRPAGTPVQDGHSMQDCCRRCNEPIQLPATAIQSAPAAVDVLPTVKMIGT